MMIHQLAPTVHRSPRPPGIVIDTIVVHSMSHPESPTPEDLGSCVARLHDFNVSAHFFIDRRGGVWGLVPPDECAWHAGVSQMPEPDRRERVNDFSIGIELIACPENMFTDPQYHALHDLIVQLSCDFPIRFVVGHSAIALPPGRKNDPGGLFDWARLAVELAKSLPTVSFPGRW